eukprot:5146864-Prorocentrum_lima.AAC.1
MVTACLLKVMTESSRGMEKACLGPKFCCDWCGAREHTHHRVCRDCVGRGWQQEVHPLKKQYKSE